MPARSKAKTRLKDPCAELKRKLKEREAELNEARAQQSAVSDILRVISGTPTDPQPVFDTILSNATRLCDAYRGSLQLYDGNVFTRVADQGATAASASPRTLRQTCSLRGSRS